MNRPATTSRHSPTRHMSHPMGWVLLCVIGASIMCGIVWHGRAFMITGTLLVIVVAGIVLPYFSIRQLFVKITPLLVRVPSGQGMPIRIQIENQNRWAWGTTLVQLSEHPSPDRVEGTLHEHMVPRIDRQRTSTHEISLVPTSRGLFPAKEGKLITRFPFGLFTAEKNFTISHQAIVWPEIVPLASRLTDTHYAGHENAATTTRHWGDEGDIAGPRPYRPGESLRRVHWRHTARRGELIVCERESTSLRRIRIRLDLLSPGPSDSVANAAYEVAISIAASLISQAIQDDWHVDFDLAGHRMWEGLDKNGMTHVLDYLATFDADGPTWEADVAGPSRRDAVRSVLVTPRLLSGDYPERWHDEIFCTSPVEPKPGLGSRCVWLPSHVDWRKKVQQTGTVPNG